MNMQKKNKTHILFTCICASLFFCACDDTLTNNFVPDEKAEFYFCTKTEAWGNNNYAISIEDGDGMVRAAVYGDDLGQIRSLNVKERKGTRAVLQDRVATDDMFTLAAYYDYNGEEKTYISPQNVKYVDPQPSNDAEYWMLESPTEDTKYWKLGSQAITTYAWWPQSLNFDETTKKIIDYEIQDDVVTQPDLLYSYTPPTFYLTKQSASIQFKHALTAVQFVMAEGFSSKTGGAVKVTKIELYNLYYKGEFDVVSGTWDVDKDHMKNIFTLEIPEADAPEMTSESRNLILNPGDYTLLMMPQDLSETPCEAIFYLNDGNIFRATLNHSGIWEPGQSVRLLLKGGVSNGYIIYASSQEAPFTGSNGTDATKGSISITSYRLVGNSPQPQRWKVTGFSIDGGRTWNDTDKEIWTGKNSNNVIFTEDAWCRLDNNRSEITGINTGNATGATTIPLIVDYSKMTSATGLGENINNDLESASEVSDYDLSKYTVTGSTCNMTTANCYIVHAPGTYKFPAVYGNAIRNGSINSNAYNKTDFVNYKGVSIGNPYIYNDTDGAGTAGSKLQPTTAALLWYEPAIQGAITNVRYDKQTGYVSFKVNKDYIYQGNAVIALYDANNVCMWSWHIWITTAYRKNYSDNYRTLNSVSLNGYTFAPCPVGTVFIGRTATYGVRSVMLNIKQCDDSGNVLTGASTCKVYLSQGSGKTESQYVTSVYYQWGRKDPRPSTYNYNRPSNYTSTQQLPPTYYTPSINLTGYDWNELGTQCSMSDAIKFPQIYKRKYDGTPNFDWCSISRYHWWNASANATEADNTTTTVTKTIYDPCPAGYVVPHMNTLNTTILTTANGPYSSIKDENGSATLNWRTFSSKLICYYSGYYYRSSESSGLSYQNESSMWFANAASASSAYRTRMDNQKVYTHPDSHYRSNAAAIHPITGQ